MISPFWFFNKCIYLPCLPPHPPSLCAQVKRRYLRRPELLDPLERELQVIVDRLTRVLGMERQSSARAPSILNHTGSFLQLDSHISSNAIYNGSKILNGCKNTWFPFWWSLAWLLPKRLLVTVSAVNAKWHKISLWKRAPHKNDFMRNAVQGNI